MQAVCSQIIFWVGLPVYQRLLKGKEGASSKELAIVAGVVLVMQAAYWVDRGLQPRPEFRRNVVLGHVLVWIGEITFFFPHALAALIVFDKFGELDFVFWKFLVLAGMLFAVSCYKRRLDIVGEAMIESEKSAV